MSSAGRPGGGRARPVELFHGPYRFGGHRWRVRDGQAPILELSLQGETPVIVEPRRLLWRDPFLELAPWPRERPSSAGVEAALSMRASGHGRLALTAGVWRQAFMLSLPPGRSLQVRRGHWLCTAGAYHDVAPSAVLPLERFAARDAPGLLVLCGAGDIFELLLAEGECIDVPARALLYAGSPLSVEALLSQPVEVWGGHAVLRCTGPGVLAIQTGVEGEGDAGDGG